MLKASKIEQAAFGENAQQWRINTASLLQPEPIKLRCTVLVNGPVLMETNSAGNPMACETAFTRKSGRCYLPMGDCDAEMTPLYFASF